MSYVSDIIIIGGGVMGASISYNLAADGFNGKIKVIEKDNTYTKSSTTLSAAGIREQFSQPISILMANYDIDVFERFEEDMEVEGVIPHIDFKQIGQMIVASKEGWSELQAQARLQQELGAKVDLLSIDEIAKFVPQLNMDLIAGGSISRRGGTLDAYGLLQGFIKKGKSLGVEYVYSEVTDIVCKGGRIESVRTNDGDEHTAPIFVLAAGPWSQSVGLMMDLDLPVRPLRRMIHTVRPQVPFNENCPKVFLGTGPSFTLETGGTLLVTRRKDDEQYGINFKVDYDFFLETVWPEIATAVPSLEALKLESEWAGLYNVCIHDSNDILGLHPEVENLYMAIGFSGHGLQQSPAVGKGLSELIRLGAYETLDLTPFRFERFQEKDLIEEKGLVGTFEYDKF